MKKIKYLILIIIVLLFSGCSGNYNLTFNKDLSVTEELNAFIENDSDNYDRTYKLIEEAGLNEEDYEVIVISDEVKIVYKKKYDSFEEYYLDSKLYKMLFENIEYTKDNVGMSINTKSNLKLDCVTSFTTEVTKSNLKLDDKDNQNIINSYDMDDFKINIKVPSFVVKKNNADSVKDDTYTWTLNSDDTYKEISIKYDYKQGGVGSIIMLVLIGIASTIIIVYVVHTIMKNKRI